MPRFRTVVFAFALLLILAISAISFAQQVPVLVTQPVDNSVRTVLAHSVHPLARSEYDQGEAPASMTLHRMLLALKRSDQQEAALLRLIENQQKKKSPSYHQWLTPEQFGKQFGPADLTLPPSRTGSPPADSPSTASARAHRHRIRRHRGSHQAGLWHLTPQISDQG